MKVLLINGSTKLNGCVFSALSEVASVLEKEGVGTEIVQLGAHPVRDCTGCKFCAGKGDGHCAFDDDVVNALIGKAAEADGFVFGSPVFYAHPSGQLLAVLDRMFYAGKRHFAYKPGAAVVTARRAGTTASLDVLNKYFTDACMPVVSSTYWNMAHGNLPEQLAQDEEGLQTMRNLGRNMAWLLKCIELGKKCGVPAPTPETAAWTSFVR